MGSLITSLEGIHLKKSLRETNLLSRRRQARPTGSQHALACRRHGADCYPFGSPPTPFFKTPRLGDSDAREKQKGKPLRNRNRNHEPFVRRRRLQFTTMGSTLSPNGVNMEPKWYQNGAQIGQGTSQGRCRTPGRKKNLKTPKNSCNFEPKGGF